MDAFRDALVRQGRRVTSQRLGVYQYLLQTDRHPTAEEIYRALRVRFPTISPATVYKTLELLVEMGLVTEMGFGAGANRYDGDPGPHLNLVCRGCGTITDLDEPLLEQLARAAAERTGFRIVGGRHEFYGFCSRCRGAEGGTT